MNHDEDNEPLPQSLRDELLGALAPRLPPAARADALRARVMAAVAQAPQEDSELSLALTALKQLEPLANTRWQQRWPGIELCMLRETADSRSYLMRMRPGSSLPAHRHSRDEVSMILEGEAWVGDAQLMKPGDIQHMPAGIDHAVIRSPGGCVAFIHGEPGFRPRLSAGLVARFIQYTVQRWSR